MDTISLQNTKTLEKVFTSELQQRKLIRHHRQTVLFAVMVISSVILGLYVFTPLFTIIS
jgi:hypothetical protein